MRRVIFQIAAVFILASFCLAADTQVKNLTDGSGSVAGTWKVVCDNGTTTYICTANSLLALKIGTVTNAQVCVGDSSSKIQCTTDPNTWAAAAHTHSGVYVEVDADLTSLAGGISGVVKGLGNGNGYSAAAYGDVVTLWASGSCSGYLKSDGTCSTPSGGVDVSGTPAQYYWTTWVDADTIKGTSITASKPICSDANGEPAVCAGTEGTWAALGQSNTFTENNTFGNADTDTLTLRSLLVGGNSRAVWIAGSAPTPSYATGTNELYVGGDIEAGGTIYAASFQTTGAVTATSFSASASSDPSIILTDSDTADGTAKIYGRTGGSNDVVMSFYVEVAGSDVEYLQINGSTETIAALKPVTIAASQYLAFGADPADAGAIRLSNADKIMWEASAAGTDIEALSVDSSEVVQIGAAGASGVTITPALTVTGTTTHSDSVTIADGKKLIFDESAGDPNDADIELSATDGVFKIAAANGANNEDLTIDLDATSNEASVNSSTGVTKINFNSLNLATTGIITGAVNTNSDANGMSAAEMTTAGMYGTMFWATGAGTWNLPGAATGMSFCVYSTTAASIVINPDDGDTIVLNGTALSAGDSITSAGAAGDFICLLAKDANTWYTLGRSGTWTDTN